MTPLGVVQIQGGSIPPISAKPSGLRLLRSLGVILFSFVACVSNLPTRASAETAPATITKTSDARSGSLLLKSEGGYVDARRLGIDVNLTVSGPTIRAQVTQIFQNPTNDWVEAVYVYPLPDGAAVDTLKMMIGDRFIMGDIKERQQARVIYEQAKQDGKKAALTEQERPNIFTNSVANIGPGESVLVQIEYQEPVHQSGSEFSLRVPMVVGPRYNPQPIVQTVDLRDQKGGWTQATNDPVPDRDRITPPLLDPSQNPQVNPTAITVRLQAGFPLDEVKSHFHAVKTESPDAATRVIKLADGPVPADRDFELTWKAAAEKAPSVGLFREHVGDADYLLAYVTPPAVQDAEQKVLPREAIFVIDNSGSMGGTSMQQAKASLLYALGRLKPNDRFNVIRFDHTMTVLFPDSVPADRENVTRAKAYVDSLNAAGGTEMVPAMRAALNDRNGSDGNTIRQVVFLTDGAIGNEQQLFDTITALRGRSRVFMVGIGSAPNTHLMTRASELGRGSFTHIGSVDQVEARMRELFGKLESPAVTGLTATFSDAKADMTPANLPDVYRGEPLVLAARLDKLVGTVEIKGKVGDRPWSVKIPLQNAAEGEGLSKVWARRKISDAEIALTMGQIRPEEADKRILSLALTHQLVTRLTSLVAVDETPSRPKGEPLKLSELPINLPAGWDYGKLFGEPSKVPGERDAKNGNANGNTKLAMARTPQPSLALPQTATDAELKMMLGAFLMTLALLVLASRRRRFVAH